MNTLTNDREELLTLICDVLASLAEDKPSFTAQSFVDRARANLRFGNYANAIKYVKLARDYVLPVKVAL